MRHDVAYALIALMVLGAAWAYSRWRIRNRRHARHLRVDLTSRRGE